MSVLGFGGKKVHWCSWSGMPGFGGMPGAEAALQVNTGADEVEVETVESNVCANSGQL